jgi:hypothetical protein
MGTKKMIAGVALAMAATGAVLGVTALPAAADTPSVTIPGMSRLEFIWWCAASNGSFVGDEQDAYCTLPNGALVMCREGGSCVIFYAETAPGTPDPRTPPTDQRPTVTPPTPPIPLASR